MKRYIGIIIFVSLFIGIVSIIAILTARGITFSGNDIKESGILAVESDPDNAKIYINDKEEGSTPDNIELIAGTYKIKLEKDGYVSWEKEVEIEPSIVTDLKPTLFSQELNLDQITYTSIDKTYFSNDASQTIYTVIVEDKKQLWLQNLEKSIFELSSTRPTKIAELDEINEECLSSRNYDIKISYNNQNLMLECSLEKYKLFYILENYSQNSTFRNLNEEIGFNPKIVVFGFDNVGLIIDEDDFIAKYNLSDKQLHLLVKKSDNYSPNYCQLTDNILLINDNFNQSRKEVYRIDSDSQKTKVTLPEEVEINKINNIFCSVEDEQTFVLTGDEATYFLQLERNEAKLSSTLEKANIKVTSWAKEGNGLLFEKDNELFSISISTYPDGNTKLSSYKISNDISANPVKTIWAKNSLHLVVNEIENKKIYIQDIDGENKRLLFEGAISFSDAFSLSSNETFLVLLLQDDDENSNLYSLQLRI